MPGVNSLALTLHPCRETRNALFFSVPPVTLHFTSSTLTLRGSHQTSELVFALWEGVKADDQVLSRREHTKHQVSLLRKQPHSVEGVCPGIVQSVQ